jgi:hypothetical protein
VEQYICPSHARRWDRFNRVQRAVYRDSLKYIEYSDGAQELFDLDRDPQELDNLAAVRTGDVDSLEASLQSWLAQTQPLEPQGSAPAPADPERLQILRDLGYIQ